MPYRIGVMPRPQELGASSEQDISPFQRLWEAWSMTHGKVYDISTLLGSETIGYPGDTPYSRTTLCTLGDGSRFNLARLEMSSHSGTHLDAPAHFVAGGKTIDQYAVSEFIFPARVIDVDHPEAVHASALTGVDITPGEALLFKTRTSDNARRSARGFTEELLYLTRELADLCVEKRVKLVGIDSVSVDRYGDEDYPVHERLSTAGILILEGIDLALVPSGRYTLIALPLRIEGGEAAPARAILFS
jgi:arylformamidase